MSTWKATLFRWLGKDPEGVVVSFLSGEPERAAAMARLIAELVPDRRHFFVVEGEPPAGLPAGGVVQSRAARRELAGFRIALAPALFDGSPSPLRALAFRMAPTRILAFNRNLERHHLRLSAWIASWLFLRGVPLDRIFLRPSWLAPWKKDRSEIPRHWQRLEGRAAQPELRTVALLSPYFPWPLAHGGAVRIYHLLREAARDFNVVLYAFEDGQKPEDFAVIQALCTDVYVARKPRYREPRWSTLLPPEVCEYRSPELKKALAGIPLLQTEYTQMAWYGGQILVEHDVTFDLYRQIHERENSLRSWWDLYRWVRFEKKALRQTRTAVVMSEKDRAQVAPAPAVVISNGVDLERFEATPESSGKRLLFVGSFRHFPNVLAYRFLVEEVWPLLDEDVELTVVAGPDPDLYYSAPPPSPRIRRLGFVSDVVPLYRQANLVVIPTMVSAGTNLKALEAMAMERAIVSTPSGVGGLGLEDGVSVRIAPDAPSFAAVIRDLLTRHEARREQAVLARRIAEERYDWRAIGRIQRSLWNDLLSRSGR